ncbi:uncharacterized protein RSE6_08396 [Rhynchosporium secalis]|uniref:MYND-type domain-containing protein n=1 Tax=Rhynchosporium secalis TaxID=38038 RepID=A0A1E1MFD8_RHYSE|nr:uncharacterized protein RSE6_08396 [Rhynchosporium secalis]
MGDPPNRQHSPTNFTADSTAIVRCIIRLGDHRFMDTDAVARGTFYESVPASRLHKIKPGDPPDVILKVVLGTFLWFYRQSHIYDMFAARQWKCIICQKPATAVCGKTLLMLSAARFKVPRIMDIISPICSGGSTCNAPLVKMINDTIITRYRLNLEKETYLTGSCAECASSANLTACTGCGRTTYCSPRCETNAYKKHRSECLQTRGEQKMAMAAATANRDAMPVLATQNQWAVSYDTDIPCATCDSKPSPWRCMTCGLTNYCTKECRIEGEDDHKEMCLVVQYKRQCDWEFT